MNQHCNWNRDHSDGRRIILYRGTSGPAVSIKFEGVDLTGSVVDIVVSPSAGVPVTFSSPVDVVLDGTDTIIWAYTQAFVKTLTLGLSAKLDVFRVIGDVREKLAAFDVLVGGAGDFFDLDCYVVRVPGPAGPKGDKGDTGEQGPPGFLQGIEAGENVTVDNTDPAMPAIHVRNWAYNLKSRYGAVGNGSAIDTAAVQDAFEELCTLGGQLYMPPGEFIVDAAVSQAFAAGMSINVVGAGRDVSKLRWVAASGGISLTAQNAVTQNGNTISMSDFSLLTDLAVTASPGSAIYIDGNFSSGNSQAGATIHDVIIRGTTSADAWLEGVHIVDNQQTDLNRVYYLGQAGDLTNGEAFIIEGPADPTDHFLTNCRSTWGKTGLKVRGAVEGVELLHCTLLGVGKGVDWDTTALEPYLIVSNSHINADTYCIYAHNLLTGFITNNLLYELFAGSPPNFKFSELNGTYACVYTGNTHYAFSRSNSKVGVELSGTGGSNTVDGNIFYGAAGDPIDTGILVGASNANNYIGDGNRFILTTTPYTDNATTTRNEVQSSGTLVGTPTAQTGTLTSAASALIWEKRGKKVRITGAVAVTTAGTGAGELRATLPFTCGAVVAVGNAQETNTGTLCTVKIVNAENFLRILKYDSTTIIANGRSVTVDITYEAAS